MKKTYVGFLLENLNGRSIGNYPRFKAAILLDILGANFNNELACKLICFSRNGVYYGIYLAIIVTAKCFISNDELNTLLKSDVNSYVTQRKSS